MRYPSNRQLTGRQLPDSHPPVEHNLYSGRASPANARLSPRQHLPAIPLCFGRNEVFDECTRPLVGFQPRDFQKCFFVFHGYAMIAKIAHIYELCLRRPNLCTIGDHRPDDSRLCVVPLAVIIQALLPPQHGTGLDRHHRQKARWLRSSTRPHQRKRPDLLRKKIRQYYPGSR